MPKNTLYFRPSVYSVVSISARGEGGTTERIFFHLTDNQATGTLSPQRMLKRIEVGSS